MCLCELKRSTCQSSFQNASCLSASQLIKRSSLEFLIVIVLLPHPRPFSHSTFFAPQTSFSTWWREKKNYNTTEHIFPSLFRQNLVCATSYNFPSSFPNAAQIKILFCRLCCSLLVLKFISISCVTVA